MEEGALREGSAWGLGCWTLGAGAATAVVVVVDEEACVW